MPKVQKLRRNDWLIQQHKFPVDDYGDDEALIQADHDRLFLWDNTHATRAFREHTGTGCMGLGDWVRTASPAEVLALLADLFKVEKNYPGVKKWTGYRISRLVRPDDGYPVFSLWLFAKRRGSNRPT